LKKLIFICLLGVLVFFSPASSFAVCSSYVPIDSSGQRVGPQDPWPALSGCAQAAISACVGGTNYTSRFYSVDFILEEYAGSSVCYYHCWQGPPYADIYVPSGPNSERIYRITRTDNFYNSSTYDFDCDGIPDAQDTNPDTPPIDKKGCTGDNTNTAYDNKQSETAEGGG
jgi:hypothetical protein